MMLLNNCCKYRYKKLNCISKTFGGDYLQSVRGPPIMQSEKVIIALEDFNANKRHSI